MVSATTSTVTATAVYFRGSYPARKLASSIASSYSLAHPCLGVSHIEYYSA
jgi:hypothetical protein